MVTHFLPCHFLLHTLTAFSSSFRRRLAISAISAGLGSGIKKDDVRRSVVGDDVDADQVIFICKNEDEDDDQGEELSVYRLI
jgi:hypothetical protein